MEGDQWHGNKAENYRYIKSLIRRDFILSFSANKPNQHSTTRKSMESDPIDFFDKGYADYTWHNQLTSKGIFWVTRIRGNATYRVLKRKVVDKSQGVSSDQVIEYTSNRSKKNNLRPVRRVGIYDAQTNKHYVFITNHFDWSAKTIAAIYKQRWQVELFFKWVKQNLKIKAFIGTTDNAVMTQVMVALCVYLILAYLKFQARIGQSLQQMSRLIHLNLFARRDLIELFKPPPDREIISPQLVLL